MPQACTTNSPCDSSGIRTFSLTYQFKLTCKVYPRLSALLRVPEPLQGFTATMQLIRAIGTSISVIALLYPALVLTCGGNRPSRL